METPEKEKRIFDEYYHVDNGGFRFWIDPHYRLHLSYGFFGYAGTEICMNGLTVDQIEDLGKNLLAAAIMIKNKEEAKEEKALEGLEEAFQDCGDDDVFDQKPKVGGRKWGTS